MLRCSILIIAFLQSFSVLAQSENKPISCTFKDLSFELKDKGRTAHTIGTIAVSTGIPLLLSPEPATKKKGGILVTGGFAAIGYGNNLSKKGRNRLDEAFQIGNPNSCPNLPCDSGFIRNQSGVCVRNNCQNEEILYQESCVSESEFCRSFPDNSQCACPNGKERNTSGICGGGDSDSDGDDNGNECSPPKIMRDGLCVESCPSHQLYSSQGLCINKCPNGYIWNEENKECHKNTDTCQTNRLLPECTYDPGNGGPSPDPTTPKPDNSECTPSHPNYPSCLRNNVDNPDIPELNTRFNNFCKQYPQVLRCQKGPDEKITITDPDGNILYPNPNLSEQDKKLLDTLMNPLQNQAMKDLGIPSSYNNEVNKGFDSSHLFNGGRGSELTSGRGFSRSSSQRNRNQRNNNLNSRGQGEDNKGKYAKAYEDMLNNAEDDSSFSRFKPVQYGRELIGNPQDNIFEQVSRTYKKLGESSPDFQ